MSRFRSLPLAAAALCMSASVLAAQTSAAASATPPSFKAEFLGQFESSMSKFVALAKAMPADTHMNEHLGQSIAYARSNGVVPPWSQ
jgi:purine-cytosine permease-like protein